MSLIDTWAATGAGAFSLSENALYTVEAWQTFFNRLTDDGIFTVSRWYDAENLGETGRLVSLAVASLLESGITQPADHLAMFAIGNLSTLLVSKQPFTNQELTQLKQINTDLAYQLIMMPKTPPHHDTLKEIISVSSLAELRNVIADKPLNYEPPTDDNPYFFNMLKWQTLYPALQLQAGANAGVIGGNLHATLTLISLIVCLFLLTLITIIIPLLFKTLGQAGQPQGVAPTTDVFHALGKRYILISALYFSLIGAGFMFVEIALIQRLSVFLGHPTYALGILLFTLISSTGITLTLNAPPLALSVSHRPDISPDTDTKLSSPANIQFNHQPDVQQNHLLHHPHIPLRDTNGLLFSDRNAISESHERQSNPVVLGIKRHFWRTVFSPRRLYLNLLRHLHQLLYRLIVLHRHFVLSLCIKQSQVGK